MQYLYCLQRVVVNVVSYIYMYSGIVLFESCVAMLFFFFFQAEDGIRDADVTGVQTCALPIYVGDLAGAVGGQFIVSSAPGFASLLETQTHVGFLLVANVRSHCQSSCSSARCDKIGRASCRERV